MHSYDGSSKSVLQGVTDSIKMAREYALLGQYTTSSLYFENVLQQIDEYVFEKIINTNSYTKKADGRLSQQWKQARIQIDEESKVVSLLEKELSRFSNDLNGNQNGEENFVVNNNRRSNNQNNYNNYDDDNMNTDPDVWAPPAPKQQLGRAPVRKPAIPTRPIQSPPSQEAPKQPVRVRSK
jgi:katanin p60 ATPase-containing subunit A1